uniref:UPF0747 protein Exig_1968 n=1 Tax=Anthurium amnicola TaxID=1678845 RepID=A0A1D1XFP0_9ARAE
MDEKSPPDQIEPTSSTRDAPSVSFDPSRMIGVIRRKALIRDLAAAYHTECLSYCQELLELQRKWGEATGLICFTLILATHIFLPSDRCIIPPLHISWLRKTQYERRT